MFARSWVGRDTEDIGPQSLPMLAFPRVSALEMRDEEDAAAVEKGFDSGDAGIQALTVYGPGRRMACNLCPPVRSGVKFESGNLGTSR